MVTLLNARLADYLGSTGDLAGMGRHLAAAERAYDRADITTAVSWLAFISPAELNGLSAIAHQSVGRYDRAERLVSQTLEILGPQFGRNRTYYTVLLSELQLAGGDVERAAATISEVRIEKVTSSRISSRVDQVASAIRRHRGGQS
ncbi:hypothetical protein ACIHFE_01260 [Streptomyces sp. NPDC052396]|uniref:hypothetical protein n=1 Tax=Streptomyces sp. NPDC052396 TaxID=3365689 RepID=UPI0037D17C86